MKGRKTMSRSARITTAGAAVLVSLVSIALVTSAFTPSEQQTIRQMKQRMTKIEAAAAADKAELQADIDAQVQRIGQLEDAIDGLVGDMTVLMENQTILSNDIDIIDAGLAGLVAEGGPIPKIDQNLLLTQEYVFARVPAVILDDITPIVACTETAPSTCTVDIEWTSVPPATGRVEWGPDEAYGNLTTKENGLLGYHKQRVGTFPADGATYHFRILADLPDGSSASAEGTVTAA
jgi:hypothetical protein